MKIGTYLKRFNLYFRMPVLRSISIPNVYRCFIKGPDGLSTLTHHLSLSGKDGFCLLHPFTTFLRVVYQFLGRHVDGRMKLVGMLINARQLHSMSETQSFCTLSTFFPFLAPFLIPFQSRLL